MQMTLGRKMAAIRKEKGIRQVDLAYDMGYSPAAVGNYENERCPVSADVLLAFRGATNMEDTPMLEHELADLKKRLCAWYDLIIVGRVKCAKELYDKLAHDVKWSYDDDLKRLFEIFCVMYYHDLGEKDKFAKMLVTIKEHEHSLTDEHLHFYWFLLGIFEYYKCQYKSALKFYLKAEVIGARMGLSSRPLDYSIGCCLVFMGYSNLAIEYLEKSQLNELDAHITKYGSITQKLLAICHSRLGRVNKAHKLLDAYDGYLIADDKCSKPELFVLHCVRALVCNEAGDYEKALENYEIAIGYYNEKDELYLSYICDKATLLRSINKTEEVNICINEGLSLATKGTIWYEWLNAVKHSLTLSKKSSEDYLMWTAIPRLTEYGQHYEVMKLYTWLSDHFTTERKHKPASECTKEAFAIYSRLMKGDLSL